MHPAPTNPSFPPTHMPCTLRQAESCQQKKQVEMKASTFTARYPLHTSSRSPP